MDSTKIAFTVIIASVLTGLIASTASLEDFESYLEADSGAVENRGNMSNTTDNSSGLVYGTAHDHALFHVAVNNSERDFSSLDFQLNSEHVHLENGRSDIVHKHSNGVTWQYFLDTINTTVEKNESQLCINITGNQSCGNGRIVLNSQNVTELDREIEQGDNLLIIIGEDLEEKIKAYMSLELPENYKPEEPGYSV